MGFAITIITVLQAVAHQRDAPPTSCVSRSDESIVSIVRMLACKIETTTDGSGIAPEMEPKAIRLRNALVVAKDSGKKHQHRDLGGRRSRAIRSGRCKTRIADDRSDAKLPVTEPSIEKAKLHF